MISAYKVTNIYRSASVQPVPKLNQLDKYSSDSGHYSGNNSSDFKEILKKEISKKESKKSSN